MYKPTVDTTSSNAYFILDANNPQITIFGSQENPTPSQINAVIPTEAFHTDWAVSLPVGGLTSVGTTVIASLTFPSVNMHDIFHEHNGAQNMSALEVDMQDFADGPFGMPAPTCGLAGGYHCAFPLDESVRSLRLHLHLHEHNYPKRLAVQCPWTGCFDTLLWMNMIRHIQSRHLGVRFRCFNCGKLYTRPDGLARHAESLKCRGVTHAGRDDYEV